MFRLEHYNDASEVTGHDRRLHFWLTVALVVVSLLVLGGIAALVIGA